MKIKNMLLAATLCSALGVTLVHASGPYTAKVLSIQSTELGRSDNVVFLDLDVTDSTCASTNQFNRFRIKTEVQQTTVFIAAANDNVITIFGDNICSNGSNIEGISAVRLTP